MPTMAHEQLVSTGESSLFYRDSGTSTDLPDIVLEAGAMGTTAQWSELEKLLAPHARVISYDRAGTGKSPWSPQGIGAVATTQRLDALLGNIAVRSPFVLLGYSKGGLYARHYAATFPAKVLGLVLVDAPPDEYEPSAVAVGQALRRARIYHWGARLGLARLVWLASGGRGDYEKVRQQAQWVKSADFLRSIRDEFEYRSEIRSEVARIAQTLTHPALLVLAGTHSSAMNAGEFVQLQAQQRKLLKTSVLPLSRLEVVEGAIHSDIVSASAHAAVLAAHILSFIQLLQSRGTAL